MSASGIVGISEVFLFFDAAVGHLYCFLLKKSLSTPKSHVSSSYNQRKHPMIFNIREVFQVQAFLLYRSCNYLQGEWDSPAHPDTLALLERDYRDIGRSFNEAIQGKILFWYQKRGCNDAFYHRC